MKVCCPYCQNEAQKMSGAQLYPHRSYLHAKLFYVCIPCDARVGCHDGTEVPLGTMANARTRKLRMLLHEVFDQIWRSRKGRFQGQRSQAYAWLARQLEMPAGDCHIGSMDAVTCERAIATIELAYEVGALGQIPARERVA